MQGSREANQRHKTRCVSTAKLGAEGRLGKDLWGIIIDMQPENARYYPEKGADGAFSPFLDGVLLRRFFGGFTRITLPRPRPGAV